MNGHWAVRLGGALLALTLACGRAPGLELSLAGRPFDVTGWAMVRQGVPVNQSTPDDRNLQQLWLRSKYSPVDPLTFDATINFENGGPTTERTKGGIYSYRSVFQSVSPSVTFEEAFVNLALDAWEVRAGIQKFAWGRLDRIQAVDVLNVERFSDPFLLDEDERKIGVPAVQGSYYLPRSQWTPEEARLTLVWIPQYFPYWFPLPGERWYPPAGTPPSSFPVAPLDAFGAGRLPRRQQSAAELSARQLRLRGARLRVHGGRRLRRVLLPRLRQPHRRSCSPPRPPASRCRSPRSSRTSPPRRASFPSSMRSTCGAPTRRTRGIASRSAPRRRS